MSRKTIFVDLDRTLFDTNQFMVALWEAVGQLYPKVDVVYEVSRIGEWYEHIGDLKHYLFPKQFAHATGDTFAKAAPALHSLLRHEQFAFPDAMVIKMWPGRGYDVRIVSFGAEDLQKFKLSLMPEFDEPRDIILEAKGPFLMRNYPNAAGFMVDDKRNPHLPVGIKEVWLDRTANVDIKQEAGIITINSLEGVEELL
jgi:hypothetical protein